MRGRYSGLIVIILRVISDGGVSALGLREATTAYELLSHTIALDFDRGVVVIVRHSVAACHAVQREVRVFAARSVRVILVLVVGVFLAGREFAARLCGRALRLREHGRVVFGEASGESERIVRRDRVGSMRWRDQHLRGGQQVRSVRVAACATRRLHGARYVRVGARYGVLGDARGRVSLARYKGAHFLHRYIISGHT